MDLSILLLLVFAVCQKDDAIPTLNPPTLVAPTNGATISVNPPTLVWNTVNETSIAYRFEVAADSLFGTIIFSSGPVIPPDTSCTLDSVLTAGTYYWHACTRQNC